MYVLRAPMRVNRALGGKVMMVVVLLRKTASLSFSSACLSARFESDEIISIRTTTVYVQQSIRFDKFVTRKENCRSQGTT